MSIEGNTLWEISFITPTIDHGTIAFTWVTRPPSERGVTHADAWHDRTNGSPEQPSGTSGFGSGKPNLNFCLVRPSRLLYVTSRSYLDDGLRNNHRAGPDEGYGQGPDNPEPCRGRSIQLVSSRGDDTKDEPCDCEKIAISGYEIVWPRGGNIVAWIPIIILTMS